MEIEKSREQFKREIVVDSLQQIAELVQSAKAFRTFPVKAAMLEADFSQINRGRIIDPSQRAP